MNKLYQIFLFILLTLSALPLNAQDLTVKGIVKDSDGYPMPGAGVAIKGTTTGVITDLDGNFEIKAKATDKLIFSFIGFVDQVAAVSSTPMTIILSPDTNLLEETVVVGYGTQKRATLTGAVSTVSNKDITATKNENVVNMLSGKIPGVRITQNSSQPGEFDTSIDIRGMGEPLIVVDGVPRDRAYFSRMDSNEIDNISVLKDASAAIYGVRAANGVILVTTKRGSSSHGGKFDIDFSANVGLQTFLYVPKTTDALTHMMLLNEKTYNSVGKNYPLRTSIPAYSEDAIAPYRNGEKIGTDWNDEIFKDITPQQQYNLSMNGSSEKVDYFFNLGYMDQMGSYKSGSLNYNRWNFRSNVDARITKRLSTSLSLSGYKDLTNQPYSSGANLWEVYKKAWTYDPTSIAWADKDKTLHAYDTKFLEPDNPVASTDSDVVGYRKYENYNFNGSLAIKYDIPGVEGLNAKAFYSFDYTMAQTSVYKRPYNLYAVSATGELTALDYNNPGIVNRKANPNSGQVIQLSLNYSHKFAEAHNINAMFLYEEQYNKWEDYYAQRETYFDSEYLFAGEDTNQIGSMTGIGDKTRRAFIGRLNYDYKSKYMIDFAFREDASSSFPAASRWGFFPSVSAGWRISEENFVKYNAPWITNLKLRASYGLMGDDASAGTYPQTLVGYDIQYGSIIYGWMFDGTALSTGVSPTSIPNLKLTWYTAETYNAGVDWTLWKGKFGGTAEFFMRNRDGLLATSTAVIPSTVGASLPQENIESDRTFGWEVQLSHYNKIGEVNYWVTGQVSATKNRWIYHLDSKAGNSMANWYRGNVSGRNKDIWFSFEEAGRFQNYEEIQNHPLSGKNYSSNTLPGDYYYEDWNEDGVIDDNDRHPVATYNLPVFNYGLTMGLDWRGIDFSMNWQGAAGVYTAYTEVFSQVGWGDTGACFEMYLDRWHTADPDADPWNPSTKWIAGEYPATGHSFNDGTTGIQDASYVRLKTLELGYTLPKKWLFKANIQSLRIYFSGYNLLTICGLKNIDPERPGAQGGANFSGDTKQIYNYPVNRTFNFGVNIKF